MSYSGEGNLIEAVILGDPNKTVIPAVCDSQGRLIIDLGSSTITIGTVDIQDSAGNPLTSISGSLNTNVTNFPVTQPVSGSVTATQGTSPWIINGAVTDANLDKSFGTWSYYAGVSGTVNVTTGQRVLGLTAYTINGGTMVINGGSTITIPANVSFLVNPLGNLIAPTIVFTGTDTYFIEVVV